MDILYFLFLYHPVPEQRVEKRRHRMGGAVVSSVFPGASGSGASTSGASLLLSHKR